MSVNEIRALPLVAQGLAFRYGRLSVLREVNFEVAPGMIWALVGANGAGKTTLFSVLSGLAQAQQGSLSFGDSGGDEALLRAKIAVVSHEPQAYAKLSARENLHLFADLARLKGLPVLDVDQALERFELSFAADRQVAEFSRGMAQRVALARAWSRRPDLYLLDEPFTALDRRGKSLLAEILREETQRGASVVLASHDFPWICEVADKVAWLDKGRIAQEFAPGGEPDKALARMRGWIEGGEG